ncbi:hypothetical protein TNCV_2447791 [Trichonephila clavipes]|uniref:Uncharacterized protein n=1 Tax=Trichonephila clavipes TaxID=2585209 RepID=A0A8X6STB5_TRICX|nr:hypothetical protein TNCV_2447791 [Trichonephila clavipes]
MVIQRELGEILVIEPSWHHLWRPFWRDLSDHFGDRADAFSNKQLKGMPFVKQRMNIKFCVRLEKSATETFEMLKHVCGSDTQVWEGFEWHRCFRQDKEIVEGHFGRPLTPHTT